MSNNHSHNQAITIRRSNHRDDAALERLAQLEGWEIPAEPLLLAETDGIVQAALSLTDGGVIADPFAPTGHLVEMLKAHAAPVGSRERRRSVGSMLQRRAPWPA